jgi:predicted nucleotidyltransferase
MTREQVIQLLQERRPYLASEFGLSRIGLFGSFAQRRQHENSDVDLVVELSRPLGLRFMELAAYLEQAWERRSTCSHR